MEEASVDQVSSGQAGVGERTTAAEIETAAAGVVSTLSYFGVQISEFVRRKTKLRIPNILQVYFDPKNPMVKKITGEPNSFTNSAFNTFSLENAQLSPGADGKVRRGRKIIEVYRSSKDMPSPEEQNQRAAREQMESGEAVELVAIPSKYFRDMFDFDVKVVTDKRIEKNKASEQAIAQFKAQTYLTLGQGRVNVDEVLAELMEANGDDPTRLLLPEQNQQQEMTPEAQQSGMSGAGGNNVGRNATQAQVGNAQR